MTNYDDTNRGALFKNDKQGNENRPDYKGQINFNGQDCWLSAWLKKSKNGTKYMSLSVQPKEDQVQQNNQAVKQMATPEPELDEEIPF